MEVKKLYPQDNKATMVCDQCGKTRIINVSDVKHNPQKVRCSCKAEFFISIEGRKFYRKQTKLLGEYVRLGERTGKTQDKGRMIVTDLSRGGLGFSTESPHNLRVQDIIQVTFNLDDTKRSEVNKRAVVRRVASSFVGAEFLDLDAYGESNRALGFYLIPR